MAIETKLLWYANFVNYLAIEVLPLDLSSRQRKMFLHDIKSYLWDDSLLFKRCSNQVIRRCVPLEETEAIIHHCHASPYGGHFGTNLNNC